MNCLHLRIVYFTKKILGNIGYVVIENWKCLSCGILRSKEFESYIIPSW